MSVSVYRYKVLLSSLVSDETRELEVISSNEDGAVAIALHLVGDLHGKRFSSQGVTLLSEV